MDLRKFLADAGYHPDTIQQTEALVEAVHAATTAFGYEIGAQGSTEGGILGKSVKAVTATFQDRLDTGQQRRLIRLLHNTYNQAESSFQSLNAAWTELRDAVSIIATKLPATTNTELDNRNRQQLDNIIHAHIKLHADHNKRLDGFFSILQQMAAPYGILPNQYITLNTPGHTTEGGSPAIKGRFYPQTQGMPSTLKWGASPTEVRDWFHKWSLWYPAACPQKDNMPLLIHYVRLQLDNTWEREIGNLDWGGQTLETLQNVMDQKFSQLFPITKRTVDLINLTPLQSNETPCQLCELGTISQGEADQQSVSFWRFGKRRRACREEMFHIEQQFQ